MGLVLGSTRVSSCTGGRRVFVRRRQRLLNHDIHTRLNLHRYRHFVNTLAGDLQRTKVIANFIAHPEHDNRTQRFCNGMGSSRKHADEILADSFRGKTTDIREDEGDEIRPAWDDEETKWIGNWIITLCNPHQDGMRSARATWSLGAQRMMISCRQQWTNWTRKGMQGWWDCGLEDRTGIGERVDGTCSCRSKIRVAWVWGRVHAPLCKCIKWDVGSSGDDGYLTTADCVDETATLDDGF